MDFDLNKRADFSATDSVLGYLYQFRVALLSSLNRLANDASFAVYFETLDDVVFGQAEQPPELLQLKHHSKCAARLTDASPDFWRTLRVWMEGRANHTIPENGNLFLVTTSRVSARSAASMLLNKDRNVPEAAKKLELVATTSANQINVSAYRRFRKLTNDDRIRLLNSVTVVPDALSIDKIGDELLRAVRLTVPSKQAKPFLDRLEGRWLELVQRQMMDRKTQPIESDELGMVIDDLRKQFMDDALPVDQEILSAKVEDEAYKDYIFVRQVKLAGIGDRRVRTAIRDYFRASKQRSRWMREDLLLLDELDRYEKHLTEEWEINFNRVGDSLSADAADGEKRKAAQKIYDWVEQSHFQIRKLVDFPSLSRGSFHILADSLRVGWHPDFMDHLKHLLESKEA